MPSFHGFAGRATTAALLAMCLGCANMNSTQKGAALGGAGGAGLGAIIGHQFGATGAGALIGGLAGTATGALAGNAKDEADEKQAYARQAAYEQSERARQARAMTNRDVADMVANGITDKVVVSTMQDRGGNFDLSPQGIIALQKSGVSDTVIQSMQHYNGRQ
jgi:uncharacterized protein YcfJ